MLKIIHVYTVLALLPLFSTVNAADVDLPEIGTSADQVLSPLEEQQLGQAFMRRLRESEHLLDDPEVNAYLTGLGYRLVAYSDKPAQPFTFFVVRDENINAFAVPGGFIGINSGLILHSRHESEVASVLAHEIAHVTQRHIARGVEKQNKMSIPALAAFIAAIAIGVQNPDLAQAAIATVSAGSVQMQLNFTRRHEAEADRVGIQILNHAGFNPHSMADFFSRMQSAGRYSVAAPEFLRSHPVTTDRIAEAKSLADTYSGQDSPDSSLYELIRAKILVIGSNDVPALTSKLREALLSGKYRSERATRYGLVLALLETGHSEGVEEQLEWLTAHDDDRIMYRLAKARLAELQKQPQRAIQIHQQTLLTYPEDIPTTLTFGRVLLEQNEAQRAKKILQNVSAQDIPEYHRLMAEIWDKTGDSAESALSLAEYYYLKGKTGLALEQLRQADNLPGLDFYVRAKIQARLKTLKKELQEAQTKAEPTS